MSRKPTRYHVVIGNGTGTQTGSGLGEYTNKKVAISEGKAIIGDSSRWFVWDSWKKRTAYNSWWD